ncbi:MAG TPA: tRNA guanosine(34) transglycosylase Tgt [Candidatus Saccharibacteria bacterium]|mgnify:FL=1|nr:tRNA guanosine(34) transglycosylase Tgt [Candidatus Saccharibacteria bacterium]
MTNKQFSFIVTSSLGGESLARTGIIHTPHGDIKTPAFIVVGTKAAVKAMVPEQVKAVHAQAVLANASHLYLQPGHKLIENAGGLAKFMNWNGPTFTDSGGFQVLSLGSGYKKVLDMSGDMNAKDAIAPEKTRHAFVDNDGVNFKSHLDGSMHRFTPEHSMQVQYSIGADIIFAFDELTSLHDNYQYQKQSLNERTHPWAKRSLDEIKRLRKLDETKPYQALFGVLQGANFQDLREHTAEFMSELPFDGYGIGGALEKSSLGEIIRWVNQILPTDKPKHLLGISEPDDIFAAIEQGIDTFDCVSPTRVARNGAAYTYNGRVNIKSAKYQQDFTPVVQSCECYTCQNYTKAYIQHLLRAKESLAGTLLSIHNEHFIIKLVDDIRNSINDGSFYELKKAWLARYYHRT